MAQVRKKKKGLVKGVLKAGAVAGAAVVGAKVPGVRKMAAKGLRKAGKVKVVGKAVRKTAVARKKISTAGLKRARGYMARPGVQSAIKTTCRPC